MLITLSDKLNHINWDRTPLAGFSTSVPIIGRYERNEIKPSIEVAKKIADELGVTIDYLIGGSDQIFDKKLLQKIQDIESLSDEEKQTIFSILDAFVGKKKLKDTLASVLNDV